MSRFSEHQDSLPSDALPKNFSDAIIVARAMDIKYVWIDSPCIVQDEIGDWEIASSKMASLYQNVRVVIYASNSDNCRGGLLNTT